MIVETEKIACACGNNEPIEWCDEYCQMCWEEHSSRTWWEMVKNLTIIAETINETNY